MQLLLCVSWLIFLGAALAGPLYWLVQRWSEKRSVPKSPEALSPWANILFLTPACMHALGACAAPSRLRHMSVENIERKLRRAFSSASDMMPPREQYETWPVQASLICAGARADLEALQRTLREKFGLRAPIEAPKETRRIKSWSLLRLLALMLTFFLLSWLAWWQFAPCKPFISDPVVIRPPVPRAVELSGDLIFDFNHYEPLSPAHTARVKSQLMGVFRHYEDIKIKAIRGQTDPIGSTVYNQELGEKRAQFIRTLIQELIDTSVKKTQFKEQSKLVDPVDNGPNMNDFGIWSACFSEFNLRSNKNPRLRPLVNLDPSKNDGRVPCEEADAETGRNDHYPACARMPYPSRRNQLDLTYPKRAEQLREMIACLAPMRNVVIEFEAIPIIPSPIIPSPPIIPSGS